MGTKRPPPSSIGASERMRSVRRRDTGAEMQVRTALHRRGLRYRVDFPPLGGRRRADIAFPRAKIAVYIHGCYWHLCPEHRSLPKSNSAWWLAKLTANQERDRLTRQELEANGWACLTFWEHEDPEIVAETIEFAVRGTP
jgi:DNA mismatch endonuclease (patch repair protein)